MKRSAFLFISGVASFGFGALMFFMPSIGTQLLGLPTSPEIESVLRGMGGLIIGSGVMNFLFRNADNITVIKPLLLTNIITHLFGLSADLIGVASGVLTIVKMAPVEVTHLFVGGGSLLYLLRWKKKTN